MAEPVRLRDVHGDVGAAEKRLDVGAVGGEDGDADAGLELDREPVEHERLPELRRDPADDLEQRLLRRGVRAEEPELVAAEARERVGLAHDSAQPAAQLLEQRVSVAVAERVVDVLEAVEVDEE